MIGMSKGFDTANQKTLLEKLETNLYEDEMRMIYLIISNVKLKVREEILTNIGAA